MFENKKMVDMTMMVPVKVFKVESNSDYDGFENYCAYEIPNNRYLPACYTELVYLNQRNNCEHEDDSYCMKHSRDVCPHMRKIGYIQVGEYRRLYPQVGEYVVVKHNGDCFVANEATLALRFRVE